MTKPASHPCELLPLWDILGDTIVTTHGVYLRGLRLRGLDSQFIPSQELQTVATHLYDCLAQRLPENVYLQILLDSHSDYRDIWEKVQAMPEPKHSILALQRKLRIDFLKGSNLRRHSLSLFFGFLKGYQKKEFFRITQKTHRERLEELDGLTDKMKSVLEGAGIQFSSLDREGILDVFWPLLNPTLPRVSRGRQQELSKDNLKTNKVMVSLRTPREYLFSTDGWEWDRDFIRVGKRFFNVLTLKGLPLNTRFTDPEVFYDLDFDFRLSSVVTIPSQATQKAQLDQQRKFARADSGRGGNVEDYSRTLKVEEGEQLAELLAETGQRLVKVTTQVVLWGDSKNELKARKRELEDRLRNRGYEFFEERNAHDRCFFQTFPGMAVDSKRHLLLTSANAVDVLPVFEESHGDVDPVMLLKTSRGELFSFNPFEGSRDNWNATVFGSPGSGKSVTMNMLITNAILQSKFAGRVIVVDFAGEKKSSYLMVSKLFGGEFIPFLTSGSYAINPFPDPKDALDEAGKLKGPAEAFLTTLTDILLSNTGSDKEAALLRNVIQKGLRETYARSGDEAPTYSDLLETIRGFKGDSDLDGQRLLDVIDLLTGFVASPKSKIFNQRSTVKVKSNFIVLDLFGIDALEPNIAEAVVFLTCQWVKEVAFDTEKHGYTYVILDEVAQLLKREEMTKTIDELLATSRKHLTAVWLVTQSFATFAKSPLAGVVILNTTTQIFLSHASDEEGRKRIADHYAFSDRERELFNGLKTVKGPGGYSQSLLRTRVKNPRTGESEFLTSVIRMELSPFDYEVCTSDARDREIQGRFIEKYPEMPLHELLQHIAYKWKPSQRRLCS